MSRQFPSVSGAFIVCIVLAATALLAFSFPEVPWGQWPGLLLMLFLITFAMSFPVEDPRGVTRSPVTTLCLAAIYLYGPGVGMLVAAFGALLSRLLVKEWPPWRVLGNSAQHGLSVFFAGLAFLGLGGRPGTELSVTHIPAIIGAVLALHTGNNFLVACFRSSVRRTRFLATLAAEVLELDVLVSNLLSFPLAVLLAVLFIRVHPLMLLSFLASLPFQRQALKLYFGRSQLYAQVVDALVIATDVNFPKAKGHARRVAELSVAIAREMRLADPAVEAVQVAALLHDVGMIGLDDLLERFANLSREESNRLKEHVLVGAEIARELPRRDIAYMVLSHHEHFDGTGYPRGLKGKEIPLGARILAVAETYESMTSGYPPYQSNHAPEEALQFIRDQAGRLFDPEVVQAFLRVWENERIPQAALSPSPSPLKGEGETEEEESSDGVGEEVGSPALQFVQDPANDGDRERPSLYTVRGQDPPPAEERRDP